MKKTFKVVIVSITIILIINWAESETRAQQTDILKAKVTPKLPARVSSLKQNPHYGKIPLYFIPNRGQANGDPS